MIAPVLLSLILVSSVVTARPVPDSSGSTLQVRQKGYIDSGLNFDYNTISLGHTEAFCLDAPELAARAPVQL